MAEETPDAKTLVKKFFHDKNRPFGANEVILSLQKQVSTKSHIQKSIDALGKRLTRNVTSNFVFGNFQG